MGATSEQGMKAVEGAEQILGSVMDASTNPKSKIQNPKSDAGRTLT
jgi:hypothetical protein